jgi:diaminopimelate epimerase
VADTFPFVKGHGTENDFIVLPDPDGTVHGALDAALVRALCDRRAGLGADGVLRAIRSAAYDDPDAIDAREHAEWFMDYRNSDGSVSEMCGNGVRVFARYLGDHCGAETDRALPIGTRDGIKTATFEPGGRISVDMGRPRCAGTTNVAVGDRTWPAVHVSMGNPHAVVFVDHLDDAGDLRREPAHDTELYPDGVNVEFVVRRAARHLAMRVHERGSGETRSCGTGACAAMVAAASVDETPLPTTYRVDVPGGELAVTWTAEDRVLLAGPVALVADGSIRRDGLGCENGLKSQG